MGRAVVTFLLPPALALSCFSQPPSPPVSSEADIRAVEEAHRTMKAASARADWDAWVEMHAPDAVVMVPNRPAIVGRPAVREHFRGWPPFEGDGVDLMEVEVRADLAYVMGRYVIRMTFPGGGVVTDTGKTLEIWRRQADGRWLLSRDMSSSDLPRR